MPVPALYASNEEAAAANLLRKRKLENGQDTSLGPAAKHQRIKQESANGSAIPAGTAQEWTEELEQSLIPTAEECAQLASVLRMLDKHGIVNEELPDEAGVATLLEALTPGSEGFPHSISTLEFYLDLAMSTARDKLQSRLEKGKQSANSTSNDLASSLQGLERFESTIKRLFEECKDSAARRMGRTRVKKVAPKYALHRTIGPNNLDIFTSAGDLTLDDEALSSMKDTDVVAVYPTETSSLAIPKLSEVNGPAAIVHKTQPKLAPAVEPVAFLYYGAYESFAPTYDSSTATLSYSQSTAWRTSRQTLRNWEKKRLPSLPPLPPTNSANRPSLDSSLSEIDPALFGSAEDASQEEIKQILRIMEDNQIVDERLKENTELLRVLQEAQFEKLRNRHTLAGTREVSEPTELEMAAVKRLEQSLTALLNARPRAEQYENGIVPAGEREFYKTLKRALVQPERPIYQGTLDVNNSKSIRDRFMSAGPGQAGTEMVDAKPNLSQRRNSSSPKKAKKSVPSS